MTSTRIPPPFKNREDKLARTNDVARAIISAEEDALRSRTEQLRALRLEQEAAAPPVEKPKPRKSPRSSLKLARCQSRG